MAKVKQGLPPIYGRRKNMANDAENREPKIKNTKKTKATKKMGGTSSAGFGQDAVAKQNSKIEADISKLMSGKKKKTVK